MAGVGGVFPEGGLPAGVVVKVLVLILVQPGVDGFDGNVHSGEGDIAEPGDSVPALHPLDRLPGDEVGDVAGLLDQLSVPVPGQGEFAALVTVVVGVDATGQTAVSGVEAELIGTELRGRAQMPLAEQAGVVATVSQQSCQRLVAVGQHRGVAGNGRMGTEAAGVTAAQQGGAGRRAHRTHVVLQELDALGGEAVDVWGAYGGTVHAQVPPTEVVGQDEEDVRSVHDTTFAEAG